MLIFLENEKDEKLIAKIKAACEQARLSLSPCFNDMDLKTFEKAASAKSSGVYLFPRSTAAESTLSCKSTQKYLS